MIEKICPRCRRVMFSDEEEHTHPCFDMDAKIQAEIEECKQRYERAAIEGDPRD